MSWYFVRHGQTQWNVEHRLQGSRDIPLNDTGKRQAEALRDIWKKEGITFRAVYCSPLQRACRTAEILTGRSRDSFHLEEELKEMDFGVMEGEAYERTPQVDISLCMEQILGRPGDYVPQGRGETFAQVLERTKDFLLRVREAERDNPGHILVVSHGAVMHGLLFHL